MVYGGVGQILAPLVSIVYNFVLLTALLVSEIELLKGNIRINAIDILIYIYILSCDHITTMYCNIPTHHKKKKTIYFDDYKLQECL